jgi:hypothetical protein
MLNFKSKKMTLPLFLSLLIALLAPVLTQAEPYGTGDIASTRAEEQRAAIAKRKERIKKEKEAEAKKAAEAPQAKPSEAQQPSDGQKEEPAAQ